MQILITSVPPGEAPLWVREKWVGLTLPLAGKQLTAMPFYGCGVLTGPRGFLSCLAAWVTGRLVRESGFAVASHTAIELLAIASPEAAAWWYENTPHLGRPGRYFVFQEAIARLVDQ
jgi:hypothetical protein